MYFKKLKTMINHIMPGFFLQCYCKLDRQRDDITAATTY